MSKNILQVTYINYSRSVAYKNIFGVKQYTIRLNFGHVNGHYAKLALRLRLRNYILGSFAYILRETK